MVEGGRAKRRGRVEGKVAIVTGGASGMGEVEAKLLAREGARVVVADVQDEKGAAVAAAIGEAARYIRLDVADENNWRAALAETVATFGRLDILVNNAGIAFNGTVEEFTLDDWRRIRAVDLDGVFLGCKHAIAPMAATVAEHGGDASIVNIASIAANVGLGHHAAYVAAKSGVRHLTKSVALHCARKGNGIRCNSVHPGPVETPLMERHIERIGREETYRRYAKGVPLRRLAQPIEIAYGVLYLASAESAYCTGTELIIDGGYTAQ